MDSDPPVSQEMLLTIELSLQPVLYDLLFYLWLFFVVQVLVLVLRRDLTMLPMLALKFKILPASANLSAGDF